MSKVNTWRKKMKKLITITLIDDRKILRDITLDKGFPFGAPANDPQYAQLCQIICVSGYTDVDNTNDKQYVHIAPSQIKSVKLSFEK